MLVSIYASEIYNNTSNELHAVIEIDDRFKIIDVPFDELPNVSDDFYIDCLKAAHDALAKKFKGMPFYYQIDGVESVKTGNTLAER